MSKREPSKPEARASTSHSTKDPTRKIGPGVEKEVIAGARDETAKRAEALQTPFLTPQAAANRLAILESPSYQLAEVDIDFLSRKENRPLRMQLELLKTETLLREHQINATVVVFGGTQIMPREQAEAVLREAKLNADKSPNDPKVARSLERAQRIMAKSHFYDEAREFSRLVSTAKQADGQPKLVVMTGGGPGVMEAANRGAFEVGAKSIGLNIDLPHEQEPNPYITPDLCFQFHYFALRKFHFVLRAAALVVFPGGFGTLDELFDCLCLRQTRRMQQIPVILYGREYWQSVITFQ
ncbi:MAG TPA: LOG family protein, partial [Lacipirellulaceae bacterium]|nr:LOG family protein [Lacipirellulaceae bacterium]